MRKNILTNSIITGLIILIGCLVYYPSLWSNFMWDDELQLVYNPLIRSISNIPLFFASSTFYQGNEGLVGGYYRPFMTTAYTLLYPFTKNNSFGYHLAQLIIHVCNTILIFYILRHRLTLIKNTSLSPTIVSFFATLFFLLHPMNSEVVSYIANMQDALFVFFGLIALLNVIYIKSHVRAIVISSVLILFSLFSKETGILFIPLISFYIYLFKRRYFLFYIGAYTSAFLIFMFFRCRLAHICSGNMSFNPISHLPFIKYIIQLPALFFYYIKTFFFPKNVAIGQHWYVPTITFSDFILPLIASLLFLLILISIWLRLYYLATINKKNFDAAINFTFFGGWFFFGILMHMHIMPLDFTVADRWFYFPMVGLLGMITVYFLSSIHKQKYLFIILLILLIPLTIRTWQRNNEWNDTLQLYINDNSKTTGSFDLENNIGAELYRRNKVIESRVHFLKSIQIAPQSHIAVINLGITYEKLNDYKMATFYYKSAMKAKYYPAYERYVIALIKQKKYSEAKNFLKERARKDFPTDKNFIRLEKELLQKK